MVRIPKIFVLEEDDRMIKILKENFTAIFPSQIYIFDRRRNLNKELSTVSPDVVLCNMQMKETDAEGVLGTSYFKKLITHLDVPVIAISEKDNDADLAIHQGAQDFFCVKDPYFINLLSWSLNLLLNKDKKNNRRIVNSNVPWLDRTGKLLLMLIIAYVIYLLL